MTVMTEKIIRRDRVRDAWNRACDFDGIPRDSQFVNFSLLNPHREEYDDEMREYLAYCKMIETTVPL